jgi:cytochrome oxidase assembly protein ShyY1
MTTITNSPGAPAATRSRLSTARSALALLRERAWYGALFGVIVISVVFVFLGRWQYHRHEARSARNHLVNTNFNAPAVPLSELLPTQSQQRDATLPGRLQWRPVSLSGSYLIADTVLLRNRPQPDNGSTSSGIGGQGGQNGYEVVIPFRTTQGLIMLVDRGWIPAGTSNAARPDSVPSAPAGTVQVVARLRPSESSSNRKAPAGQANRLNIPRLAGALPAADAAHVVGAYGLLVSESPAATDTPTLTGKPDPGLGINFAYAVQWIAFAIAAYVMFGVSLVREVRRRDQLALESAAESGSIEDDETGTPAPPRKPKRPDRPLERRYG